MTALTWLVHAIAMIALGFLAGSLWDDTKRLAAWLRDHLE